MCDRIAVYIYPKKGYKFLTNAVMTLEIADMPCYNSIKARSAMKLPQENAI